MRSPGASSPAPRPAEDDRSTPARIRDAAIQVVAERGVAGLSARGTAEVAGVSPALVIHHFGSMDALRVACDEHVAAVIRQRKQAALASGPQLDVLAILRDTDMGPLTGYLAAVLTEESPAVATRVDDLVSDAEGYLQNGVDSGMLQPSHDPHGRAVILTLWGLGVLVLNQHLKRLLGVDLVAPGADLSTSIGAYARPIYEIYSRGVFSPAFAATAREAIAAMGRPDNPTASPADAPQHAPAADQRPGEER